MTSSRRFSFDSEYANRHIYSMNNYENHFNHIPKSISYDSLIEVVDSSTQTSYPLTPYKAKRYVARKNYRVVEKHGSNADRDAYHHSVETSLVPIIHLDSHRRSITNKGAKKLNSKNDHDGGFDHHHKGILKAYSEDEDEKQTRDKKFITRKNVINKKQKVKSKVGSIRSSKSQEKLHPVHQNKTPDTATTISHASNKSYKIGMTHNSSDHSSVVSHESKEKNLKFTKRPNQTELTHNKKKGSTQQKHKAYRNNSRSNYSTDRSTVRRDSYDDKESSHSDFSISRSPSPIRRKIRQKKSKVSKVG